MNVQQLNRLPPEAPVLLEGDAGYAALGGVELLGSGDGRPGEVVLQPDMTPD